MEFTYKELQKMQREAPIKNGVLTFDETTTDIQFLTLTDKEELKEVRFETPQPNLRYLDFGRCKIEKIVFSADCKKLQAVYLQRNQLTHFEIKAKLPALELLDLSFNENLTELKINSDLPTLKYLYLHKCKLKVPPEIIKAGTMEIVNYYKALTVSEKAHIDDVPNNEVKLIIVGNSGVGKTTLVHFLKTGNIKKNIKSTIGVDYGVWKRKSKNGKELKIRIFDFGGQEYFHDTHHMFFSDNTIYLVMWVDSLNKYDVVTETHNQLQMEIDLFPVTYWLDAIDYFIMKEKVSNQFYEPKKNSETDLNSGDYSVEIVMPGTLPGSGKVIVTKFEKFKSIALVVQNKIEQKPFIVHLNNRDLKSNYSFIYDFAHLSLHEKLRINELKSRVVEVFENISILDKTYPGHWYLFKESLDEIKEPYLKIDQYVEWCQNQLKRNNIDIDITTDEVWSSLIMPRAIGQVYYFKETSSRKEKRVVIQEGSKKAKSSEKQSKGINLDDYVFLDIEYILKAIYSILTVKIYERNGEIDKEYVIANLKHDKNKSKLDVDLLLALMLRYHLIFEHPESNEGDANKRFVVPQYLPDNTPEELKMFIDGFSLPIVRYRFPGYIHKSVVLEFFCAYGRSVFRTKDSRTNRSTYFYWKNGLILSGSDLQHKDKFVMVQFDRGESIINVSSFGMEAPTEFLLMVVKKLDEITSDKKVRKEIRASDGKYIPWDRVLEAATKSPVVEFEGKFYQIGQFRSFLHDAAQFKMKKVFISYSSKDITYLKELETHLTIFKRSNLIESWHDRKLLVGEEWDKKIKSELEEADITIFLVSPDFMATDYVWDVEMKRALERHGNKKTIIFPVIVRDCYWEDAPFANFNVFEKGLVIGYGHEKDGNWKRVLAKLKEIITQ